jgi:hypothetical protein
VFRRHLALADPLDARVANVDAVAARRDVALWASEGAAVSAGQGPLDGDGLSRSDLVFGLDFGVGQRLPEGLQQTDDLLGAP